MSLKRPFVPKSDVKQRFTTTLLLIMKLFNYISDTTYYVKNGEQYTQYNDKEVRRRSAVRAKNQ